MKIIDADAFEKYAWGNPDIEVDGEPYISPSTVQNFAADHPITIDPPNEPLPVLVNDEPDREYIDYICPRCKEIISQRRHGQRMETVYQCRYHDTCGQRVDWSSPQPYRRPPEAKDNNVPTDESLTLEQLRASPHGKIKDSTLQSICNRANEIACRPPEGEANG